MRTLFKEALVQKGSVFSSIDSVMALAEVLEIKKGHLVYYAYKMPVAQKYKLFEIAKRSGKMRPIQAPVEPLKLIQKKLLCLLQQQYSPKACVHGFIPGRSVITNAKLHVRKPYLLNVDLEDFFPTIHFGRIMGLFQSKPFGFPREVAAYISQLCTYSGFLPQGAPTSPLIANMVAYSLDKRLMVIAKEKRMNYTRYADDIAISTAHPHSGEALADENSDLRKEIERAVVDSGFALNAHKTRFSSRFNHREVTGLVVNTKMNVRRKFYRQIRAMLHAWEKHGYSHAEEEFKAKYDWRNRAVKENEGPRFHKVVKGKIDWFQMVRGRDKLYQKLHGKCAHLMYRDEAEIKQEGKAISAHIKLAEVFRTSAFHENSVFVIENEQKQGSCFYLRDIGFVTCAHVVGDSKTKGEYGQHFIFKPHKEIVQHPANVTHLDYDLDVAVLSADSFLRDGLVPLEGADRGHVFEQGKKVTLCGFPGYAPGRGVRVENRIIVSSRTRFGVRLVEIDGGIYEGGSGSPVLSPECKVLGIAVVGSNTEGTRFDTDAHCFLPLSSLDGFLEKLKQTDKK